MHRLVTCDRVHSDNLLAADFYWMANSNGNIVPDFGGTLCHDHIICLC